MEHKAIMQLIGHTEIWLHRANGEVKKILDKRNAIQAGIRNSFTSALSNGSIDFAIDDLITVGGQNFGGTMASKDGIVCRHAEGITTRAFTCVTTELTAVNNYGRKWRGEVVFSDDYIIDAAALGKGFASSSALVDSYFSTMYALQTFTGVTVGNLDKLIFNWEIYS